jgi:hypothetical protein
VVNPDNEGNPDASCSDTFSQIQLLEAPLDTRIATITGKKKKMFNTTTGPTELPKITVLSVLMLEHVTAHTALSPEELELFGPQQYLFHQRQ